jgi:outer membrane scaffolding protein for murein synthesis (MipA/OmpV family)
VASNASSDWIVTLGATTTMEPRYLGSRLSRPSAMPAIGFRRVGEPEEFSAQEDGLDYTLFGTKTFQIGPVANLRGDRTAGADARLNGVKKYATTIDAGFFANVWAIEDLLRIRLEVRQGLRPDDGILADLNGDLVQKFGAFTLSGGPRLSFGDAVANKLEFGVSALESSRNGRVPAFAAHAGFRSVGYGAAVGYDWSPAWRTTLFHRFDRLVDEAAESPITKRLGSPDQLTVGIGVTYSFQTNLSALGF